MLALLIAHHSLSYKISLCTMENENSLLRFFEFYRVYLASLNVTSSLFINYHR